MAPVKIRSQLPMAILSSIQNYCILCHVVEMISPISKGGGLMKTRLFTRNIMAIFCAFFFVTAVMACFSPVTHAQPEWVIRRNSDNPPKNKEKEKEKEKQKEKEKEKEKNYDDGKSRDNRPSSKEYHHYRNDKYDYYYKFWVPDYQRVVEIYFDEAYAELNEGFFLDEKNGTEYLPGEWFDIKIKTQCFAVVNGEDMKVRYTVLNDDGDKLYSGKVFRAIFNGYNDLSVVRAFPKSAVDTNGRLYIDIVLTIEGNDAYGGFWLERTPSGNEGPLRIGDVIVSDTYYGAESNPLSNIEEGKTYKLWAEYEIDQYIGDSATVEWSLYDTNGRDIAGETVYIVPRSGYSTFSTTFAVPQLFFAGTQKCDLDVSIIVPPYIGRRIIEINVTGDAVVVPYVGQTPGHAPAVPFKGNTLWDVSFVYADVLPLGDTKPGAELYTGQELYGMFEYMISGLRNEATEVLKWEIIGPDGLQRQGDEMAKVSDGTQNRYIELPSELGDPPGKYYLNVAISINGVYTNGTQVVYELKQSPKMIKVEKEGADENYFEFTGFNLFLPYDWKVSKVENGLTFVSKQGINGSFTPYPMHRADHAGESLADMAEAFEKDAGVKLTGANDTVDGKEVMSISYLKKPDKGEETIDLYAFFTIDRSTDTFDLWVLKMTGKSSELKALYDDFKVWKEGLSFTA